MNTNIDRLYELLPAIYRIRDTEQGEPLKALLRVITEQVDLVEEDIARLYDNWFIETCEDWVVPYIADLIGYQPIHEAGEPGDVTTEQGKARNKILIPRREVANTIRYRRRKGALALLELLANDVAGWPARAVEFYQLLGWTQSLNHLRLERGRSIDVRNVRALELLDTPFDELAHTVDVRRINSRYRQGRYNIPSVGVFVWRLQAFSVTRTPAYCVESTNSRDSSQFTPTPDASDSLRFTFSVLGNDVPLFIQPEPETDPAHIADEFNLPVPLSRRLLARHLERLYGEDKSLFIWKGKKAGKKVQLEAIPVEQIVVADLSGWHYRPKRGTVAVDPELGRIAFPSYPPVANGVWVSYRYGFSNALGGGEYERSLSEVAGAIIYQVTEEKKDVDVTQSESLKPFSTLNAALEQWVADNKPHAVIEIADSRVYTEPLHIDFTYTGEAENLRQSLEIRAANGARPIVRLLDWQTSSSDALTVTGNRANYFSMDGLLIRGRGIQLDGDLQKVSIHHTTLVPGWDVDADCKPQHTVEPSLEIFSPGVCVEISHSILGPIQINPQTLESPDQPQQESPATQQDVAVDDGAMAQAQCQGIGTDYRLDPLRVCISDSIIDAMAPENEAIGAPGCPVAHAILNIQRCTVFGQVQVHAIELGENSIFNGRITVARRQVGCLRFSYVMPASRTSQRYNCQPDMAEQAIEQKMRAENQGLAEITVARQQESERVRPQYTSRHYGKPAYCQLAATCAPEVTRGADDGAEMGVFHDLFQPQRETNLRIRLDEYIPAGSDLGIIFAD